MFQKIKLLCVFAVLCATGCTNNSNSGKYIMVQGFAQGTTWHITYKSFNGEDLKPQIDSILTAFDNSMSAYNKESQLTKINNNDTTIVVDRFFKEIFENSLHLYNISGKAFDPTVSPLVSLWGFGKHKDMRRPTQNEIDSVLEFVGLDKVKIQDGRVIKTDPRITLIFNANAQGYSVDVLARWFDSLGYSDYLVEIGGEVFAKGVNSAGQLWRVGIDSPIDGSTEEDRVIQAVVSLSGKSLCTSGNYRNFFVENGEKYSHELDPVTGYPKRDSLLSVAVIAPDAVNADGLATTVMVLGLEKGFRLLDSLPDTEGYFIYAARNGSFATVKTSGFVAEEL
ncbi:MAG: FAD:protein FMN transferase [Bacteroidales bacterium]|nr:FAD:protein FMN transferase [Bacteroidales bacterium]